MDVLGLTIVALTHIALSCNLRRLLSFQCSTPCCASPQTTKSGLWERYSVVGLSKRSIAKTLLRCFPSPLFNGYILKLAVPNGVVVSPDSECTAALARPLVWSTCKWSGLAKKTFDFSSGTGIAPYPSKRLRWYCLEICFLHNPFL